MTDLAAPENKQHIELSNPVNHLFEPFIVGNACWYESVFKARPPMLTYGEAKGKELVICGAGPSLRDHAKEYCTPDRDVWGCNSAATWLYDNKHHLTHAFTVDQTPEMLREWASCPPVQYLLATSVHCHLPEMLHSKGRDFRFFHNYVGIRKPPVTWDDREMAYEDWLYALLYPDSVRCGSGLNATTRALDAALYAGYEKIYILGADCALRLKKPRPNGATFGSKRHRKWLERDTEMHADGGNAVASGATAHTMGGTIDGRHWESKPDMMVTAVFMVKMKQALGDRVEIIGDTLPNALMGKDDSYLDRLPSLIGNDGKPIRYVQTTCLTERTP